jgi:hypothetical protein
MKHSRVSLPFVRAGLLAVLSALPLAGWCAVAGQFQFVAGDVRILSANGQSRTAQKGQDISEGETVITGANASAQLKMIDGGLLALRPDSQLKMDAYVFKGQEDGTEKANMSLVKGGLRAISGLIGKTNKQNYAITTPTATIGIRGTDHEPVVVAAPLPGAPAQPNPPGTYDKVNVGSTTMSNQAGTTFVNPNQVGFASALNQLPFILASVPDFYRVTPLPVQRRPLTPGSQSDSGAQSNTGNDSPGTTNSASGSAGGEELRVSSSANPPAGGNTTTGSGSTNSNPTTPSPSSTGTNPSTNTSITVLTGVNAQGNSANFTKQEQQTSNGTQPLLGNSGGQSPSQPATTLRGHFDLVFAGIQEDNGNSSVYSSSGRAAGLKMGDGGLQAVSVMEEYYSPYGRIWLTLNGTPVEQGQSVATGLSWGRWATGQTQYQIEIAGHEIPIFSNGPMPAGGIHYIVGAKPAPEHLARVLTGTYDYVKIGGTSPTDTLGNTGTLTNASLKVNFTNQLVEQAIIGFTMVNDTWDLNASNLPLQGSGQFSACTGCGGGNLVVSKNNNSTNAYGWMGGTLTGSNLNGAAMRYQVTEEGNYTLLPTPDNTIQGVVALGVNGTAPNAATPYRATGISTGWRLGGDDTYSGSYSPGQVASDTGIAYRGSVEGGEGPEGRIVIESSGALREFVGRADYISTAGGSLENTGGQNSAVVRIGSAINQEVGKATVDGVNISWGRWEGGRVDVYARNDTDSTNKLGSIDNSSRSMHWMAIDSMTGPLVNLPLSGTATYTLGTTGFTSPTDTNGHTGTLNTATVNANFSTMRVAAQVDLSINAANINIQANNMVLGSGGGFSSTDRLAGISSPASVTCAGNGCGSGTGSGYINGQLLGQNAGAAAIAYGAAIPTQTASFTYSPGMVVNGVAVLKK